MCYFKLNIFDCLRGSIFFCFLAICTFSKLNCLILFAHFSVGHVHFSLIISQEFFICLKKVWFHFQAESMRNRTEPLPGDTSKAAKTV